MQEKTDTVFSDPDSGSENISFNNSFESNIALDEEEDYQDKVTQLKEEINKIFNINPALKDQINFNEKEKLYNSDGEEISDEPVDPHSILPQQQISSPVFESSEGEPKKP
jgi:hypothetical protein